ncbi:unnamed protein product [Pocillopora meandrina]|uniref:Endonuclease/exonuclease/phosphatase domain-containing protein n=1 Tax=Pocillopora meandrina TaxID=46732 RepID=A0AAU9WIM3_9CNID|nr:unnamed protein product [Pocillopora meandrina]
MDVETYVDLSYSQDQWFCKANNCNWPFDFSDSFFESLFSSYTVQISTPAHNDSSVTPTLWHNDQLENQRNICNDILLCHLNINSIQNKFEELVALIRKLKIHIIFISKTKIDSTYAHSQFAIPGYTLYRNDRKKGGGGILVYISTLLPSRRLKITRTYKTLESLAVEIRLGTFEMIIIGIYRPPKSVSGDYQLQLEGELNGICTWASLRRNFVNVIGDINLDRLRPDKSEGKLLLDLEVEQEPTCLIDKPTRTEKKGLSHTSTLIDVLLTNKSERFKCGGVYYPSLSDYALIYGIFKEKLQRHPNKVITFRSYKNFDDEKFTQDLSEVPCHVGEVFDDLEDHVYYWNTLMANIIDENLPLKKMRVRAKDVPYMRTKRRALATYQNDKSDSNVMKPRDKGE